MSESMILYTTGLVMLYLLRDGEASFMMTHPQKLFCDADYVFKFRLSANEGNNRERRLVPREQSVQVRRFYKGQSLARLMMKLQSSRNPADSFVASRKIEAKIRLGIYQKAFKPHQKYVFFGKMYRYRNKTMMPWSSQMMMSTIANTLPVSSITRIMNRGLRLKYAKGCDAGCHVKTVYREISEKSQEFCYWNVNAYRRPQTDCRKTAQFCYRGKDGYCQWRQTTEYKQCLLKNKLP